MNFSEVVAMRRGSKEVASVDVSNDDGPTAEIDITIQEQTRTKRLFSTSQLFAYSLTYMSVWEALCGYVTSWLHSCTYIRRFGH